jgi:HEAT repeat protein
VSDDVASRLASRDPDERTAACRDALARPSAEWVEPLLVALGDPVKAVSTAASEALARAGVELDVVPPLRRALRDEDPVRALGAALTLARLEPPDVRLLPALVRGLELPDPKRRWWAAKLLVETGRTEPQVLPLLLSLADGHGDPAVRRMSRYSLRELAPDDPSVADTLCAGTRDPDVQARRAAYTALASLLGPPRRVFERLVETLRTEEDGACRRIATVGLAQLGRANPERVDARVLDALREAADDPHDADLRRGAHRALEILAAAHHFPGNPRPGD